jgi:predicted DNA-binding protein YlxM (UPF0122 family)
MIEENKRVLLGMSGGTDSSVAAMRLLEAGYEVIGVTFRFYELNGSTEYLEDARNLAERLGIRHITYDAREIFARQIIEYFVQEYLAGRTPVPCTLCNNYLKWPLLAKIADEMGITRQGVRDSIKRSEQQLFEFEEKLGLFKQFSKLEQGLDEISALALEIKELSQDTQITELADVIIEKSGSLKD